MKVFYEHSETCSPGKSECFKSSVCRSWRGWIRCAAVEFGRSSRGCWRTWELIKSCWTCCRCPTTRWDGSPPKQKQWVGGAFSSVDCQNAASEGFWLGDTLKMNWNVLIGEMQHSSWNANCSPVRRLWFWFWFWAFWPFDRPVPCCWNFEKAVQQNEINTRHQIDLISLFVSVCRTIWRCWRSSGTLICSYRSSVWGTRRTRLCCTRTSISSSIPGYTAFITDQLIYRNQPVVSFVQ